MNTSSLTVTLAAARGHSDWIGWNWRENQYICLYHPSAFRYIIFTGILCSSHQEGGHPMSKNKLLIKIPIFGMLVAVRALWGGGASVKAQFCQPAIKKVPQYKEIA